MRGLAERGVLVRGGGALGSARRALRVTYGTTEENARFLRRAGRGAGGRAQRAEDGR